VYQAERALITQRMNGASSYSLRREADLLVPDLTVKLSCHSNQLNFKEVLYEDKPYQENDKSFIAHKKYLAAVQAVIDADLSYEEMLDQCPVDAVDLWSDWVSNQYNGYMANKKSLKEFLQKEVVDWCEANLNTFKARPYLKQQLIGSSYAPSDEMERLQRHESALDRRFEKNLAMLLRLQEVRKIEHTVLVTDASANSVL